MADPRSKERAVDDAIEALQIKTHQLKLEQDLIFRDLLTLKLAISEALCSKTLEDSCIRFQQMLGEND